ncbi:hypothetical protein M23134_02745 [Microscilla marina ATCC 23134]|uniref:Uncharacterized protein n=1 Tax=Microscilla marina ATCC 23134 TaxID=313606 RepID=A1ZWD5_MICM2|nr:hypothetical protein M23134_02745 [Microscilla marina ATCC 23134]
MVVKCLSANEGAIVICIKYNNLADFDNIVKIDKIQSFMKISQHIDRYHTDNQANKTHKALPGFVTLSKNFLTLKLIKNSIIVF